MRTEARFTYGWSSIAEAMLRASTGAVVRVTGIPRYWWKTPPSLIPASKASASRSETRTPWIRLALTYRS